MALICLDPGHGGIDTGCRAGEIVEKNIVLPICLRVRELLEPRGHTVILTRESDDTVSLEERCRIANRAGVDLFMSVHADWWSHSGASGPAAFYFQKGQFFSSEGRRLAACVYEEVVGVYPDVPRRGVKPARYYVLGGTVMPAALIELGFVTNAHDLDLLLRYDLMACVLAMGIVRYLRGWLC